MKLNNFIALALIMILTSCDVESLPKDEIFNESNQNSIVKNQTSIDNIKPNVAVPETSCTDEEIISYLSDCLWLASGDIEGDFIVDFSGMNLHIKNENGLLVDEGNWSIQEGIITLNNLSQALANQIGTWTVVECRDSFLSLSKGDELLHLEKDFCEQENMGDVSCTDEEIISYLSDCLWLTSGDIEDDFIVDFSGMNLHIKNGNGLLVDEGNWNIQEGIITFNNLSQALANQIGNWSIVECRSTFLGLTRDGGDSIYFEKDCN